MRKLILLLILIFTMSNNYSQESTNSTITKTELIKFIDQAKEENKVSENPLIVLDEQTVIELDSIKPNDKFYGQISIIRKGNKGMNQIYGENAENGIIMIQTPPKTPEGNDIEIVKSEILYFLGENEISKKDLQNINPDEIENVEVIKGKDEIAKITNKECDGIVIINLKKKE